MHCGTNAMLEATSAGVAMLTWPMVADHFVNKILLVEAGVAMHLAEGADAVPDSGQMAKAIAAAVGDKGKPFRERAGQEHVPGSKRDTSKGVASAGNITGQAGSTGSSSRLNRSVSDHGRLPDSVQQARERLLQRLNSVDLSGRRQNTSLSSETIHGGVAPGVSTTADSIFSSLTSCFHTDVSIAPCKLQESTAETFNTADKHTFIAHCSEPAPTQEVASCRVTDDDDLAGPSTECSICLERCGDADGLLELRCKHIFHSACLERWLRSRSDCPYCRASVLLTAEG
uniref:RING-type domain-containing protein n=1 Tax=Oryza nivara TaxID=4536 RepID=A0A0E0JBJ0_ORYNI